MTHQPGAASEVSITPNDVLRFLLEVAALSALGYSGWTIAGGGAAGAVVAILVPVVAAVAWGVFRVDGDPRPAPVPVPGIVRLAIEAIFFGAAIALLAVAGQLEVATVLGAVTAVHYALAHRRVSWLIRHPGGRSAGTRR
jgi:hypothetical protein